MKFYNYLIERKGKYGKGISFIDIDETIASTQAKIYVIDKESGEIKKKLDNQEFNTYELKSGEEYDFREFKDAKLFRSTSNPIQPIIDRVKRMINMLKKNYRGSWIVFLTARSDFDNKKEFLQWFRDQGIDVDFEQLYIERTGNQKTGTVAKKKEKTILKYLKKYNFRRVRMVDDSINNLKQFIDMIDRIPEDIIENARKVYHIPENEPVQEWFALHVIDNGKLSLYDKKEVY